MTKLAKSSRCKAALDTGAHQKNDRNFNPRRFNVSETSEPSQREKQMSGAPLRTVFLVGQDDRAAIMSIEAVCQLPDLNPVAVLVDTYKGSLRRRVKNLRWNMRREGPGYIPYRFVEVFAAYTDRLVDKAVVSSEEVMPVLRKAFPERCFTLDEVGKKYGIAVRDVGNLNSPKAIQIFEQCNADLGIVLGTRILRPSVFNLPRMGSINLHKGRVPEYRGLPPGFWELYDGARTAGVTVHFVSSKLDAGDVIETGEVQILPLDTPESLLEKLHQEGISCAGASRQHAPDGHGASSATAANHTKTKDETDAPRGRGLASPAASLAWTTK